MTHRLAIGTAQFGSPYGIANRTGQVSLAEATAILGQAWDAGVRTLDTAMAYGDSEDRLGQIGVRGWQVISKLGELPRGRNDVDECTHEWVVGCLARLRISRLHGLLVHRSADLLGPEGGALYAALRRVASQGLVGKVGVSIYGPEELEPLLARFPLDIVQAPLNVLDRRLVASGWLGRLKARGIEVHARSVFLQGLLMLEPAERPAQFERWRPIWMHWHDWLNGSQLSAAQACLGFVLSHDEVDRVVVGVDSVAQLRELLAAAKPLRVTPPPELSSLEPALINPACWNAP